MRQAIIWACARLSLIRPGRTAANGIHNFVEENYIWMVSSYVALDIFSWGRLAMSHRNMSENIEAMKLDYEIFISL